VLTEMAAEGSWDKEVTAANIAQLSPWPRAFDPELTEVDFAVLQNAA
jgi:hypothetical protein